MSAHLSQSGIPRRAQTLPDLWFSLGFRALAYQILVIGAVVAGAVWLIGNAQDALARLGISTGFSFLHERAGFDIGETPIAFRSTDSFLRAYAVGFLNTMKVSAAGIFLATLIGVLIGLARLSSNALIRALASSYIELFRNTPQLLQLIFWYALITRLPVPQQAYSVWDAAFISNRGLILPWPIDAETVARVLLAVATGFVCVVTLRIWANSHHRRTGRHVATDTAGTALLIIAPLAVWAASGAPTAFSVPELRGFNFAGGLTISPEFLALMLALALYIAAFIAEIVRSGIRSVPAAQLEAARAIGLRPWHRYSRIVLPQALRVMIPPATAQYVSLIKNSSLGVAIGYPELFNINNSIITLSGRAVEAIAIMMAIYLSISLVVGLLMTLYNRSVRIVER
jgi:general L-amino acid transport system permease protein